MTPYKGIIFHSGGYPHLYFQRILFLRVHLNDFDVIKVSLYELPGRRKFVNVTLIATL